MSRCQSSYILPILAEDLIHVPQGWRRADDDELRFMARSRAKWNALKKWSSVQDLRALLDFGLDAAEQAELRDPATTPDRAAELLDKTNRPVAVARRRAAVDRMRTRQTRAACGRRRRLPSQRRIERRLPARRARRTRAIAKGTDPPPAPSDPTDDVARATRRRP
jgi:hypothetical protein